MRIVASQSAIRTYAGRRRFADDGPTVITLDRARNQRAKGRQGSSLLHDRFGGGQTFNTAPDRVLTAEQLRRIYISTPAIRAPIDSIARRISTWNWDVGLCKDIENAHELADEAKEIAAHCNRWLKAPTKDGGLTNTWQETIMAVTLDILIHDEGAIERVADQAVGMIELVPTHGPSLNPNVDTKGILKDYDQLDGEGSGAVVHTFKPNQIMYLRLFPTTWSVRGQPIIETLVNEAATMLVASEHALLALDADELPPGFIVLGGLGIEAARRAKAELRSQRGADHKARVIAGAGNITVNYVPIRKDLKDLQLLPVIEQIERRIWRAFGVMPVEMGSEDSNRAHAEMQVDVSQSHLVTPLLELLEAKVQALVLPGVIRSFFPIGSENNARAQEFVPYLEFKFDHSAQLDPAGEKDQSDAHTSYVSKGVLTRNQVRARLGEEPAEGGDVLTVDTIGGLMPVAAIPTLPTTVAPPKPAPDAGGTPPKDDVPEDEPDEPGPGETNVEGDEEDAKEAASKRPHHHRASSDLPSERPKAALFDDFRTIDLRKLSDQVIGYTRDVDEIWQATLRSCMAIAESMYQEGGIDKDHAELLKSRLNRRIDQLLLDWETVALPRYRDAAKLGKTAAETFSGGLVVEDWLEQATDFRNEHLGYLEEADGPPGTVRARLDRVVDAITRGDRDRGSMLRRWRPTPGGNPQERANPKNWNPDLDPKSPLVKVLDAVAEGFAPAHHRIRSYSGKLVDLANKVMVDGLLKGEKEDGAARWYCQWICINDERSCIQCIELGAEGFQPLRELAGLRPGSCECRGNCRCVLSVWTELEIVNKHAVAFDPKWFEQSRGRGRPERGGPPAPFRSHRARIR